jgi:hypothetical protein
MRLRKRPCALSVLLRRRRLSWGDDLLTAVLHHRCATSDGDGPTSGRRALMTGVAGHPMPHRSREAAAIERLRCRDLTAKAPSSEKPTPDRAVSGQMMSKRAVKRGVSDQQQRALRALLARFRGQASPPFPPLQSSAEPWMLGRVRVRLLAPLSRQPMPQRVLHWSSSPVERPSRSLEMSGARRLLASLAEELMFPMSSR